jgi:hypothetical protein
VPLLLFCLAWDSFLAFWYGTALTADRTPWQLLLFPLGHLAVGAAITYAALAQLLNVSRVEVSSDLLVVKHGPIPWLGNHRLCASDVSRLFCEESAKRGKGGVSIRYQVNAVVRGRTVRVVTNLQDKQQALYLEQVIEARLRIPDEKIPGELPRDGVAA